MNWLHDPIDTGIIANSLVLRIYKDDLEVFIGRILVDPVRVHDTQVGAAATHTLLGGGLQRALVFELIHTLVCRFA